jgi:hypothetical protein
VRQPRRANTPRLKTKATALAQQRYTRCVAGDITGTEVRQLLDTALG